MTKLPGLLTIEPAVHQDDRGFFLETYQLQRYQEIGVGERFVQDNHSRSVRHTLRGLHIQIRHPQGKLIRATAGEIFDVAVDVRPNSPTFGQWCGIRLSASNFRQSYVPAGFAHGFYVLSEIAEVQYKCTTYYDPESETTIAWNDPDVAIEWPGASPLLSDRDAKARPLKQVMTNLPTAWPESDSLDF